MDFGEATVEIRQGVDWNFRRGGGDEFVSPRVREARSE